MRPISGRWGTWWEVPARGILHAWGVPHHWGLTLALWGGARTTLLDIALWQGGFLEQHQVPPQYIGMEAN